MSCIPMPTISLCVIAGNEEKFIEPFLESFKVAFDELCIVRAIGNQRHDKTLSLAKKWCDTNKKEFKCSEYFNEGSKGFIDDLKIDDSIPASWPHVDNFAAARNVSWSLATCDFQFWADCDDLLQPAIGDKLGGSELIRLCSVEGKHDYYFFTYDIRLQNEENVRERLFKRGISRWVNPLHETVRANNPGLNKEWKALIEPHVVFEHCPSVDKNRDVMRNRRIMQYHLRYLDAYAYELFREWYYEWEVSHSEEAKEKATKYAEIAHQTDCIPEQRYDMLLKHARVVEKKDIEHSIDLVWNAIRINPKDRQAWGDLAEYEIKCNKGHRAAVATGFMQSIPKPPKCGCPQSNKYHGWEGFQLRVKSLRAAGAEDQALKIEQDTFKKNGARISLLHATRGRPDLALLTRNTFYRSALVPLGIEHIFAIDEDDKASIESLKHYRHVIVKEPRGCVKAWNEAAKASSGNVLVQLSDDWNPCYDWDVLIWEALQKAAKDRKKDDTITTDEIPPLVLAVNDGKRKDNLLCMAILTRARYEHQKDLFNQEYFGVFSDNEFTVRAYDDGVVVQAQHIQFEHRHPVFGDAEWDDTYRRQNAPERYIEGKEIFNRRNPTHAIS